LSTSWADRHYAVVHTVGFECFHKILRFCLFGLGLLGIWEDIVIRIAEVVSRVVRGVNVIELLPSMTTRTRRLRRCLEIGGSLASDASGRPRFEFHAHVEVGGSRRSDRTGHA
jgi:hypothetical protein